MCKYAEKQVATCHKTKIKQRQVEIINSHGYKRNKGDNQGYQWKSRVSRNFKWPV